MKIGIFTQALSTNYGGILQNYALQYVLKKMGHEPFTFDVGKYTWDEWAISNIKAFIKKRIGRKADYRPTPIAFERKQEPLRKFVYKYINLITPKIKRPSISPINRYHLDGLVVGSDQVWRPQYNPYIEDSFLDFSIGLNIRRVAYAASFGKDEWEFTPQQTESCSRLAKKFNAISVREASGVKLCNDYLKVNAKHVLDPTLLLDKEDYEGLCTCIERKKPFVFAYLLDLAPEKILMIHEYAANKNLPVIIKSAEEEITMNDSIELWLAQFRDATCVFTDSFHGTSFSINFNKYFFVFYNGDRGNSRFDSLLSWFGLVNRVICKNSFIEGTIDWEYVNKKKKELQADSYNWLKESLS